MRAIGIVLAGGNSKRMRELSSKRAVAAMPVAGSYRSIDFALSNMTNSHIQNVAVFTQYNSRSLNLHLSSSKWWDFGRKQGGLYVFTPSITPENGDWYRGTADAPENVPLLRRQKATVLLLGPGLGGTAQSAAREAETQALVQQLLPGFAGSAVLDADGLNAAAQLLAEGAAFPHPAGELIVTPHPGEMARLTGLSASQINADREGAALRYAQAWNAVVVLKGARTVVAAPDGRVRVNPTGNPGLSRGGSGDVLAGMTAALLACRLPAYEAAACAVYLHGAAADRAAAVHGEYGMLPHDILPELGRMFAEHQR